MEFYPAVILQPAHPFQKRCKKLGMHTPKPSLKFSAFETNLAESKTTSQWIVDQTTYFVRVKMTVYLMTRAITPIQFVSWEMFLRNRIKTARRVIWGIPS